MDIIETPPIDELEETYVTLNDLEAFNLYEALHLTVSNCNSDRARASFHRLAYRYHPGFYSAEDAEITFSRIALAYTILKDEGRREIYDKHGFHVLKQSEDYMEPNVFEMDAFEIYDSFFEGTDPLDREYFLLNGNEVYVTDSEDEEDYEPVDEVEIGEDDIEKEEIEKILAKKLEIETKSMPAPPASVLVSSVNFQRNEPDAFAEINSKVQNSSTDNA